MSDENKELQEATPEQRGLTRVGAVEREMGERLQYHNGFSDALAGTQAVLRVIHENVQLICQTQPENEALNDLVDVVGAGIMSIAYDWQEANEKAVQIIDELQATYAVDLEDNENFVYKNGELFVEVGEQQDQQEEQTTGGNE